MRESLNGRLCAGLFCNDACLCQDCENRTDTLSAVFKARQFIMVKDPAAFKPKVIHPRPTLNALP